MASDVKTLKVGDRVVCHPIVGRQPNGALKLLGVDTWGTYAEFVKVPASTVQIVPDTLDFITAAVVGRHGPLAFTQLRDRAQVKPGEWVLVMGAAGGLGSALVQAAKYLGARVIAAAGSDARVAAALELGADEGINYRSQDLTAEARRITGWRRGQCRAGQYRRSGHISESARFTWLSGAARHRGRSWRRECSARREISLSERDYDLRKPD